MGEVCGVCGQYSMVPIEENPTPEGGRRTVFLCTNCGHRTDYEEPEDQLDGAIKETRGLIKLVDKQNKEQAEQDRKQREKEDAEEDPENG